MNVSSKTLITATAAVFGLTALALYLKKSKSSPLVLYIYEHCPYCTKAQMIFALKKVPFKVEVLLNDDEKTPISYVNAKQVPILKKQDGSYMPESMDIVHFIDQNYGAAPIVRKSDTPDLDAWLKSTEELTRKLCLARYVNPALGFQEFATSSAVQYFTKKKEAFVGDSFESLLNDTDSFKKELESKLEDLEKLLPNEEKSFFLGKQVSEADFHLFARLRCFTVIKGFKWTKKARRYLDFVSRSTDIPLWEKNSC